MTAIEMTGTIDEDQQLQLDGAVPIPGPVRVRVMVCPLDEDDLDETEWLRAAATNPVFDFLNDPEEDIYSPTDGIPFRDEV